MSKEGLTRIANVISGFVMALGWPVAALVFVIWSNERIDGAMHNSLEHGPRAPSSVYRTCDRFEVMQWIDGRTTVTVKPREAQ